MNDTSKFPDAAERADRVKALKGTFAKFQNEGMDFQEMQKALEEMKVLMDEDVEEVLDGNQEVVKALHDIVASIGGVIEKNRRSGNDDFLAPYDLAEIFTDVDAATLKEMSKTPEYREVRTEFVEMLNSFNPNERGLGGIRVFAEIQFAKALDPNDTNGIREASKQIGEFLECIERSQDSSSFLPEHIRILGQRSNSRDRERILNPENKDALIKILRGEQAGEVDDHKKFEVYAMILSHNLSRFSNPGAVEYGLPSMAVYELFKEGKLEDLGIDDDTFLKLFRLNDAGGYMNFAKTQGGGVMLHGLDRWKDQKNRIGDEFQDAVKQKMKELSRELAPVLSAETLNSVLPTSQGLQSGLYIEPGTSAVKSRLEEGSEEINDLSEEIAKNRGEFRANNVEIFKKHQEAGEILLLKNPGWSTHGESALRNGEPFEMALIPKMRRLKKFMTPVADELGKLNARVEKRSEYLAGDYNKDASDLVAAVRAFKASEKKGRRADRKFLKGSRTKAMKAASEKTRQAERDMSSAAKKILEGLTIDRISRESVESIGDRAKKDPENFVTSYRDSLQKRDNEVIDEQLIPGRKWLKLYKEAREEALKHIVTKDENTGKHIFDPTKIELSLRDEETLELDPEIYELFGEKSGE
jgi:hypothetical protein